MNIGNIARKPRTRPDEVARLAALFAGNTKAHGTHGTPHQKPGELKWQINETAVTLQKPVTETLWRQHADGKRPLGVVPIREDDTCGWGAIDYDVYDVDLLDVIRRVEAAKLPLVPCLSKSGGLHLFLFLSANVPAVEVRAALRRAADTLDMGEHEIFPKQNQLEADGTGSWMVMPYFGGTFGGKLRLQRGLKKTGAEMTLDEFVSVAEGKRTTLAQFCELLPRVIEFPQAKPEVVAAATKYAGSGLWPEEPHEAVTVERIAAALAVIPADSYQTWFEVGAALHRELGENGFALFEVWSRTSKKYVPRECADKWRKLVKVTRFGAGTVFHYADKEDAGWRARYEQSNPPQGHAGSAPATTAAKSATTAAKPTALPARPRAPKLDELTRNAADLRTRTFDPLRWVVPKYLPEGLSVLVGKPKVGKSWLALNTGAAVSSGGECLGQQCEQGDVLGLFLEDSDRRLQRRLTNMLGALKEEWPVHFSYATEWPRLADGGLDLIREWIGKVRKPRLVIVDILERVRQRSKGQNTSQYSDDYMALAALQTLAKEAQLSILVLHHQRKMAAEDLIDTVSGTLGLGGAVETVLVLGKDDIDNFLYGRGRDLEELSVAVKMDEHCWWQVLGARPAGQASAERGKIVAALARAGRPMSVEEITAAVGGKRANVKNLLSKMHFDGELERVATGLYQTPKQQADMDI